MLRSPELHPNAENATPEERRVAMEAAPNKRSSVRLNAVRSLLLGISRATVCQQFCRTDRMVRLWIERFNRGGIDALITRPKPGRPRQVKLERGRELLLPVLENPAQAGQGHWTGVKLHGYLKEQLALELGYRTTVRLVPWISNVTAISSKRVCGFFSRLFCSSTRCGRRGGYGRRSSFGTIRNSEGGMNEARVFWKRARWVDYSGAITANAVEGITFFDHPSNPTHPSYFHVRNDGWMGASLTFDDARVIETNKPLKLRYAFYVHSGLPATNVLEKRWTEFSKTTLPQLKAK